MICRKAGKIFIIFASTLLLLEGCANEKLTDTQSAIKQNATEVLELIDSVKGQDGSSEFYAETGDGGQYMLLCGQPAMGQMEKYLFYTTDGGKTYTNKAELTDMVHNYPQGMLFVDESDGFIITDYHSYDEYLYRTEDGGKTWSAIDLNLPDENADYFAGVSIQKGQSDGDIQLVVKAVQGDNETDYTLVSNDGGSTWTISQ